MQTELAVAGIHTAISLFALLGVLFFIVGPTLTDRFRETIFEQRRQLFLFMANGRVSPDDAAYLQLRATMNGFLRFAERITLLRGITVMLVNPKAGQEYSTAFEAALVGHDEATQRTLRDFRNEISKAVTWHIIRTSPGALICAIGLTISIAVAQGIRTGLKKNFRLSAPNL